MGVKQVVGDLRVFFQAAADGGGQRLAGFAAEAGEFGDLNSDAAHAAHFVEAGGDGQADAELLVHALLQFFQLAQALQVFQAIEQAFLFLAGQAQDTQVAVGAFQQLLAAAVAGSGRAGLADGRVGCHGLRS